WVKVEPLPKNSRSRPRTRPASRRRPPDASAASAAASSVLVRAWSPGTAPAGSVGSGAALLPVPPHAAAVPAKITAMTDWSRLVRPSLLGLEPYRPGPGPREYRAAYGVAEIEKLNWNESLFPPYP